jgi:hypothetical protein
MASASMTGPMKAAISFFFRTFCLLFVAVGALVALVAFCCVFMIGIVWLQEGRLLGEDKRLLLKGAAWFGGACLFVYVIWRLAQGAGKSDNSFRLTKSSSPRSERLHQRTSLLLHFLLLTTWLWRALPGPAFVKFPALAGWLILFFLGLHLQIFLHELGHLVAAWLLRFELRKVQIGLGPRLWSRSFANGLRLEWCAWSLGGFMLAHNPDTKHFRLRQSLFVAAGPLMDAVVVWCGYKFIVSAGYSSAFPQSAGGVVACVVFLWTAVSALGGWIPRKTWLGNQKVWTDGYWLWLLWTASNKRLAQLIAQMKWRHALESLQSGDRQFAFAFEPLLAGPANVAASLDTFRQQHLRLRSRLLP